MKKELHVLLLEDMTLDAELIDHELRKRGLQSHTQRVETQAEFLEALRQLHPDVILSDHGVPAFDGLAALAAAHERCPEVPFIFVTGAHGDEVAVETLKRGADDYVLKSRLHHLVPAISRALEQAERRAQGRKTEAALRKAEEKLRLVQEETQARTERAVRQRTAQLEAEASELQQFAFTVASDIRATLRHLETFSGVLQRSARDKLEPKSQASLDTIIQASGQIGRLTDELLAFCRIGQAEMYRFPFDLREVVNEALQDLRRETEGREVEWVIGGLPEVMGDPTLIGIVLTNLLSNALKFTHSQKPARIEIGSRVAESEAIVFVADNGVGFDPRSVHKLFGVFQKPHPHSGFEGLGVGLANVRRIIQRHGGRTWAEGNPGQGATFFFSLPLPPRREQPGGGIRIPPVPAEISGAPS